MAPTSIIVMHGGEWGDDNSYNCGIREIIPVPPGISFRALLNKIELRLMKDSRDFVYQIYALEEGMRIQVTDDYDLEYVLQMSACERPVLYITITPMNAEFSRLLSRQNLIQLSPVPRQTIRRNADPEPNLTQIPTDKGPNSSVQRHVRDKGPATVSRDSDVDVDYFNDDDDPNFDVDVVDIGGEDDSEEEFSEKDNEDTNNDGSENHRYSFQNVTPLGSHQDSADVNPGPRQWNIPGATFHSSAPPREDLESAVVEVDVDSTFDKVIPGTIFPNKFSMISCVGLYHLHHQSEFHTRKSCKKRYQLVCKHNGDKCPFILHARSMGAAWIVDKVVPHTCVKDLRYQADPKVYSKVLAAYFVPSLMVEGVVIRPRDIIAQVKRSFGATINYATALSARNQALTLTYGDSSKSFQLIPKYLYMLQQANPGSVVELQTKEDGKFEYCFMAIGACIRGFKACRPVIVVDGTHLKGKYKGIMFVAATKDANEQIVPLAFGFGDVECDESWTWFLRQCRITFGCPQELLMVSDKHISIKNAMEAIYPGIPHGLCVYHLRNNIRRHGEKAMAMMWHAASAYRVCDFESRMGHLKSFSPAAYASVMKNDPARWTRSKCPVRRYKFLTSNAAECVNGRLRWARKMPVCTLLECVRTMVAQWFVERRVEAVNRTEELTAYAENRLSRSAELARNMITEEISPTKYKVSYAQKHHVVDIQAKTCTCLIWNHDLIPCSHASAAIRHTKQSVIPFVSEYYSTQSLRAIYAGEVMPIPMPEDWCVPDEIASRVVDTPENPRQAGRPRENRMSAGSGSASRSKGKKMCSRCFTRGHYETTCSARVQPSLEENSCSQAGNTSKRRRTKRCSICKVSGHTRQTCAQRPSD